MHCISHNLEQLLCISFPAPLLIIVRAIRRLGFDDSGRIFFIILMNKMVIHPQKKYGYLQITNEKFFKNM